MSEFVFCDFWEPACNGRQSLNTAPQPPARLQIRKKKFAGPIRATLEGDEAPKHRACRLHKQHEDSAWVLGAIPGTNNQRNKATPKRKRQSAESRVVLVEYSIGLLGAQVR